MISVNLFLNPSTKYSNKNIIPNVIKQNKSDGGYLVTLMKDRNVKSGSFCVDQMLGSP